MRATEPGKCKECVQETLIRHVDAINKLAANGMYLFDYGHAFLLEASRAGANIFNPCKNENSVDTEKSKKFKYPSYVQDIMGPLFFDYGFGPYRWVCTSSKPEDLAYTDMLAAQVLEDLMKEAPNEIKSQMADNIHWIKEADKNH